MSGEALVFEVARQWWRTACEDLAVATQTTEYPSPRAFHAQQAVEKGIKALLVLHQIEFPLTHDVGMLLRVLGGSPTIAPSELTKGLPSLTRFAVETRYPPALAEPHEAAAALAAAERFLAWAKSVLPAEVTSRAG